MDNNTQKKWRERLSDLKSLIGVSRSVKKNI
jgi:hypothetical protein